MNDLPMFSECYKQGVHYTIVWALAPSATAPTLITPLVTSGFRVARSRLMNLAMACHVQKSRRSKSIDMDKEKVT